MLMMSEQERTVIHEFPFNAKREMGMSELLWLVCASDSTKFGIMLGPSSGSGLKRGF